VNPYEAPRSRDLPPTSRLDPPGEGSFRFEPEDAAADVRARLHASGLAWVALGVGSLAAAFALMGGDVSRMVLPLGVVVVIVALFAIGPRNAARRVEVAAPELRTLRVMLTPDAVVVLDGSGVERSTPWTEFGGFRAVGERIFLYRAAGPAFVLPRRAWSSSEEFAHVRAFVASRLPELRTSKFIRYAVILWLVLIGLFVAAWSFFSDVPRTR